MRMMTKNIDKRKVKLIQEIVAINSELEIDELEKSVKLLKLKSKHRSIFKGLRKTVSVADLKKEQGYKGIDRSEFDELVQELDIQEPLEALLLMLD